MRLHFYSMACLLRAYIKSGSASVWDKSSIRWKGDYWADWGDAKTQVGLQHILSLSCSHPACRNLAVSCCRAQEIF